MRKILILTIALMALACGRGVEAQSRPVFASSLTYDPDSQSIADNGSGSAASGTLTTQERSLIILTCLDSNGCTVTLSETGARQGQDLTVIISNSSTTCTFNDSSGVQELMGGSAFSGTATSTIQFRYSTDRWVEITRSASGGSGAFYTAAVGTSTFPSFTFTGFSSDGFYHPSSGNVGITTNLLPSVTATKNLGGASNVWSTLFVAALNHGGTLSLPTSTDTLVGRDTTDTLTNKTLTTPVIQCFTVTTGLQHCGAKVTLTDAQIKALPSTAITLVAAPGSGKLIQPISITIKISAASGGYTNINTTYAEFLASYHIADWTVMSLINDSSLSTALTKVTDFFAVGDRYVTLTAPYSNAIQAATTTGTNQQVEPAFFIPSSNENLSLDTYFDNNGSGDLTGGNAANSMIWYVDYLIIG